MKANIAISEAILFLLVSILVFLFWYFLIKGIKFSFREENFKSRRTSKLIALGIPALLFKNVVISIIDLTFGLTIRIYYDLFGFNLSNFTGDSGWYGGLELFNLRILYIIDDIHYAIINNSPGAIFIFFAFWIIASMIVDYNIYAVKINESHKFSSAKVIIAIIIGLYLSLVSIIVIPYFDESNDVGDFTYEALKNDLDALNQSFLIDFNKSKKYSSASNYEKALDYDSIFNSFLNINLNQENQKKLVINSLGNYFNFIQQRVNKFSSSLMYVENYSIQSNKSQYDKILIEYKKNIPNLKSKEIQLYYSSLLNSYSTMLNSAKDYYINQNSNIEREMDIIENDISNTNLLIIEAIAEFVDSLAVNAKPGYAITTITEDITNELKMDLSNEPELSTESIEQRLLWSKEMQLPEPGSYFGIFKIVSSWLLNPNSKELALIVGMFGFGIFGAAISKFVNAGKLLDGNNFSIVMIKGASAAIVIFLAAKGGMAIFSNSEIDLNPYVLFFACFIGSVFSDRIWDWAKGKLVSDFATTELEEKNEVKTDDVDTV